MIEVSHLTKRYGTHLAVSDLSFKIEDGQIYGFLGPNGAGKSTTMNIMTGCLAATSGEVRIDGHDIFEDSGAAKRLLGYLPEQPPLYLDRTPREYLTFVGQTILIISKGRLVACDTPENLERLFAGSTTVELTAEAPADEATRLLSPLVHVTSLRAEPLDGGRCRITLDTDCPDGDEVCRNAFFAFSRANLPILRMNTARASLEDIFIELTSSDTPVPSVDGGEEAKA